MNRHDISRKNLAPVHDPSMPDLGEVLALTLPQMGLMLCHLAISMTDIWAAGMLGAEAQASVGVVAQIFTLLMLLTSLIGSGCMATVSQSLGAGLERRAHRYAGLIILLSAGGGSCVAVAALCAGPALLLMMGIQEELRPVLSVFYTAYCCQLPFYYVLIMINSIFRAHKKVLLPVLTVFGMALANGIGDMGFGLGFWGMPAFGAAGVAWTSFTTAVLGLGANVALAVRFSLLSRFSFAPWKWCRRAMPYIFRVGVPAAAGQIIMQAGSLVTLAAVNALPAGSTAVLAGMSLGARVHSFLMFPLGAFNMSMTILGGHLLGAGKNTVLFAFGKKAAAIAGLALILPSALLWLLREPAVSLFSGEPEVIAQASDYLLFACLGGPFAGMMGIFHGLFAGAGATALSCRIGAVTCWIIAIPLAWTGGILLGWGALGIYAAGLAAQVSGAVWSALAFRQKKWLEFGMKGRQKFRKPLEA
ncbi:MAG: MATE family efflux transporter [Deltaproteobacteria bacterium]|nr:MATE family efflux transporter [Deltaproteobacteria bacterium]